MRAVVQRVANACVFVEGEEVGSIGPGLLVFLGVGKEDTKSDVDYLADKLINLRIFPDEEGKFNRSSIELNLEMLVVSQFTLLADCRKGRRPSFTDAASPNEAEELYAALVLRLRNLGIKVATGRFQAMMHVHLINDGPVTILLDSKKLF